MSIGISAYPSMILDQGGGQVTMMGTYDLLWSKDIDVELFNPWEHRLEDFRVIHHFGLDACNYEFLRTAKAKGVKVQRSKSQRYK